MTFNFKNVIKRITDSFWIVKVAQKPSRKEYTMLLKVNALVIAIIGFYSFLISIMAYLLMGYVRITLSPFIGMILLIIITIAFIFMMFLMPRRGVGR